MHTQKNWITTEIDGHVEMQSGVIFFPLRVYPSMIFRGWCYVKERKPAVDNQCLSAKSGFQGD